MPDRLQKILSARGIASRRKAEEYIEQGLVKVNGKIAVLGQKADPTQDVIEVDGKVLQARQEMLYYLLYKPQGVVTINLEGGKRERADGGGKERSDRAGKTVRDLLPPALRGKLFPVGRLDKDSEGLLLLTNDGVLAYRLTHPKFDHEKEYEVTLEEPIFDGALRKLEGGLKIFGERAKPARVRRLGPRNFRIALTEGKNRQIRRMVQKVGSKVQALRRVRIMTLEDPTLKEGQIRPLTGQERVALLKSVGLESAAP